MSVTLSNTCLLRLPTFSVPPKPITLSGALPSCHVPISHISSSRFGFKSNHFFRIQTPRFFKCLPQRVSDERRDTQVTTEEEDEEEEKVVVFERLFSNLNRSTLKRESGSLSSSIFLVAGTTVGAGILAIPAVTQESGFLASTVACILCWAFMVVTGLLVAQVNVNTMSELGSGGVSLVSMAKRTLGSFGVQVVSLSYILIHYTLLVAYIARSSGIRTNFLGIPMNEILIFTLTVLSVMLLYLITRNFCRWESATLFSLVFGGLCFFGSQRFIGAANGVLVFGVISSFAALVAVASGDLHWESLLKANFDAVPMSIPIIALSFVYQNVVPVLCTDLEGDLPKNRDCSWHSHTSWLVSCVERYVILGSFPADTGVAAEKMVDPLQQLRSSSVIVGPFVEAFSVFAIATSYIGFVLGLSDFFSDLLKLPSEQNKPLLYSLTLVPPVVLSLLDPEIFFKALDFAGTYGVLVLFGIIPAAMSWSDRYLVSSSTATRLPQIVPGGKLTINGNGSCWIRYFFRSNREFVTVPECFLTLM